MKSALTRRNVLKALGAGAVLSAGGSVVTGSRTPYTKYTYLSGTTLADTTPGTTAEDEDGLRVRVAWYETYNGDVLETQGDAATENASAVLDPAVEPVYVEDASGPVVTLSNVLPRDRGRMAIGVSVDAVPEGARGAAIWYRFDLTTDGENGMNEPERKTGDDTPDDGELADSVEAQFWEDTGSVGGIGACNGRHEPGEGPVWNGSLVDLDAALSDGVRVGGDACLDVGQTRCLGLSWELPRETGNAVQSDTAGFDLTVVATECADPNPFTGGER